MRSGTLCSENAAGKQTVAGSGRVRPVRIKAKAELLEASDQNAMLDCDRKMAWGLQNQSRANQRVLKRV
jgi:hypothetical protein